MKSKVIAPALCMLTLIIAAMAFYPARGAAQLSCSGGFLQCTIPGASFVSPNLTFPGSLIIPNNVYYSGKNSGGTTMPLIGIDAANEVLIGQGGLPSGGLYINPDQTAVNVTIRSNNSATAFVLNGTTGLVSTGVSLQSPLFNTATNCSDSAGAAACGSAASGAFVIDAGTASTVVSTTAVTANSRILVVEDSGLSTALSVTCNTQSLLIVGPPRVTARTTGTSFTVSVDVALTANPMCVTYWIVN